MAGDVAEKAVEAEERRTHLTGHSKLGNAQVRNEGLLLPEQQREEKVARAETGNVSRRWGLAFGAVSVPSEGELHTRCGKGQVEADLCCWRLAKKIDAMVMILK